jgi:hypothetical protein
VNKIDLPTFETRLNELAEAVGAKPLGAAGLALWFRILSPHSIEWVVDCLDSWARHKTKFPAPAEIATMCSARESERLEHRAQEAKKSFAHGAEAIAKSTPSEGWKALGDCRAILAQDAGVPNAFDPTVRVKLPDPKRWAHALIAKARGGEKLSVIQINAACEALGIDPETILEDPELAAERAAIQAEATQA